MTKNKPVNTDSNQDIVAISMALHEYLDIEHDEENMVLTFNEVGQTTSPWASKIFGLRQVND